MTILNENINSLSQQKEEEEEVRNRRGQTIITDNSVTMSSQYLPNMNSYKTELVNSKNFLNQHDLITTTTTTNNTINNRTIITNSNPYEQSQQIKNQIKSNVYNGTESCLSDNLINFYKTNCLLTCLLGATLFASIANTFLLSLVVKSIQLNDKGLLNGQLTWDESSQSSVFQLPTRLAKDKSISLNSIESVDSDKPLRLEILQPLKRPNSSVNKATIDYNTNEQSNSNLANVRPHSSLSESKFLLTSSPDNHNEAITSYNVGQKDAISKFNYMATVNNNNNDITTSFDTKTNKETSRDQRLEIGTKFLALNLIIDGDQQVASASQTLNNSSSNNKWLTWQQQSNGFNYQTSSLTLKRLLEFNDEQQSIILPLENKLNLSPTSTTITRKSPFTASGSSLLVNGILKSSTISGTLNRNLDVQNQNGDLKLTSEFGNLNLISKSSKVHLTSNEKLLLESRDGNLVINSKQLYISKGIHYFDKEPIHSASDENDEQSMKLKAFKLYTLDGILMAINKLN